MHATSLRLPDEIEQRLAKLSKLTGRTKTFYILEAIQKHLDDIEDIYIAEHRIAEARSGHSRSYSAREVDEMFGVKN